MIKNVILDWSGTVVNDLPPVLLSTNALLRELGGTELTLEEFRDEFCLPLEPFYLRRLPGVTMEIIDEAYHRHFPDHGGKVEILPNSRAFLEYCRASGRRIFLLSTITPSHFQEQAAKFEVADFFEHAYTGIRDKRLKIHEILTDHGLRADETLFAGDMRHDIDTAHAAGVLAVGVLSGFDSREKLTAARPDVLLRDLGDLRLLMEAAERPVPHGVIRIQGLQFDAHVGVPDEERTVLQRLLLDLEIVPAQDFAGMGENLAATVDYAAICENLRAWSQGRSWKLIETLAVQTRDFLLAQPRVAGAKVRVRKFILPDTEHVSVEI